MLLFAFFVAGLLVPSQHRRGTVLLHGKKQRLMTDLLDQAFGSGEPAKKAKGTVSGNSELSRCFDTTSIRNRIQTDIEPTLKELDSVAQRIGVISLYNFSSSVTLDKIDNDVKVSGDVSAIVSQTCVKTGNLVDSPVQSQFTLFLRDEDEDDLPVDNFGLLDVGELVLQYLCLEIDPYPTL